MRKRLAAAALAAACLCAPAQAKEYWVEELVVEALVQPDGRLAVNEEIRYRFQGSYSYAYREIPLRPGHRLSNVRVSEAGRPYRMAPGESPETFTVEFNDGGAKVTWYYSARDETRNFLFSYEILGGVNRYPDTAELYYQFVGDGWDRPIERVSAVVRFPERFPPGSVKAWAHGPLDGIVDLAADGSVRFEVSPLPERTFWEGRILFPATSVSALALTSAEPAADRIGQEERRWAEEANRRRLEQLEARQRRAELKGALLPWTVGAALAGLALWFWLFFRFGKPHPVQKRFVPGELPSPHAPALIGYLLHRDVGASALAATLIDLARRGYLKIEEKEREKKGFFGKKKVVDYRFELTGKNLDEAADYERELVDFVMSKGGDGNGVWLRDFKKATRKSQSQTVKWFKSWRRSVKALGQEESFFEPYSGKVIALNILVGAGLAVLGLVASIRTDSPVGVPALVVGVLQAIFSVLLSRRTPAGQQLYRGWMDFKKHLRSISRGLGPATLTSDTWSRYLVASILLGKHKDFARLMETSAPEHGVYAWYAVDGGGSSRGLSGLSGGISSMVSSLGSTMSSASGAGGGASGGGGGGAGGGGGGAG